MKKKELLVIIYIITILLCVMYATQPLQPLLAKEFNVSIIKISSFTAVIMLFLAISIVYGYILESIKTKTVLIIATIILLVTNLTLSFANSYKLFLTIRIVEAIVIPAILTASMSILASDIKKTKLNMSIYVASTVFGGLMGRVFSGFIAQQLGWRAVFFSLSLALFIALLLISRLELNINTNLIKPKMKDIFNILKDKRFIIIYSLMFTIFFIFAGLLNILPFRLKEQFPNVGEAQIGLLYLGYGMGIVVSLTIHKIIKLLKNEIRTIILGIIIFITSIIAFLSKNILFIFSVVFLLCIGMFIIHTVSTRIANSLKNSKKALTSGMYLSFYYIGGALGTIIPTIIYAHLGWNNTIFIFLILLIFILTFIYTNRKLFKSII